MRFHPEYDSLVHPVILVGSGVLYLALARTINVLMKSRPAFTLKLPMMIYNVAQVILCSMMTAGLANAIRVAEPIAILGTKLRVPNIFGLSLPFSADGEFWLFVHYLSKFLDFFDTIFIALRKKDRQLSFLHLYHHATIGPIWGLLLYLGYGSGVAMFGACINSFTHVLMYTHYFVSALNIRHPFKPFITSWQIFQFYSCVVHAVTCLTPLEKVYPKPLALLQIAYHLTMIVLFSKFFQETYKTPTATPKTTGNDIANGVPKTVPSPARRRYVANM
eukprot:gene3604-6196_t